MCHMQVTRSHAFSVAAPNVCKMLLSNARLAKNIAKFYHRLKEHTLNDYLYNLAYPPWLPGISTNQLTTGIVY